MKRFLKAMILRRLARTPIGAVFLAVGWVLGRRRRRHVQRRHRHRPLTSRRR
ncbi:DUF6203 family protein [Nonomuraea sp. SYSU D8015]|uniref:DUF6203 family protein n=1 Tax=Nonomuraea sp. SYSU D8015 TaxID=2593644 RepID=UPI001660665E|nr:DUF6203 family protein [Nonomuraea sp. SYSU D8015]